VRENDPTGQVWNEDTVRHYGNENTIRRWWCDSPSSSSPSCSSSEGVRDD